MESLLRRLLCIFIVDRLPTEGVEEALDALKVVFDYHSHRAQATSLPVATQRTRTRIRKAYERPPFRFDEG